MASARQEQNNAAIHDFYYRVPAEILLIPEFDDEASEELDRDADLTETVLV